MALLERKNLNFRLFIKIATILVLSFVLLIPIVQIRSLISERSALRDEVVQEMARDAGYAQTVTGPLFVVPYRRTVRTWKEATKDSPRELIEQQVTGDLFFLPETFELSGRLNLKERRRGIYRARIYEADTKIVGYVELPPHYGIKEDIEDYVFETPRLALGISDIRGIGNGIHLEINKQAVRLSPGAQVPVLDSGVHAEFSGGNVGTQRLVEFELSLALQGTGQFRVTPVGRSSRVHLASNWPHPSFVGEFLPRERHIGKKGFQADWQTSFFATNLENVLEECQLNADESRCAAFRTRNFGVTFVDPVDHYLKSERASKYAFLFIGLTFAVFFLFEVLRRFSVHPIQYGLVGLSLAVFFLLLVALSEHLGFGVAYVVSSGASILLIGYYVAHVLRNKVQGSIFSVALAGLYGLLFGILSSEDYALLTGALVVFSVLGAIMVLTRKVDWSAFGARSQAESELEGVEREVPAQ